MVIDTSAVVAILTREPEKDSFNAALAAASVRLMSAATYLECAMVLSSRMADARLSLDELMDFESVVLTPVDVDQARIAADAFAVYGKGRGHPAKLNFGDCFSYALAKATGEPLLFKGEDFTHTDIAPAL